MPSRRGNPSEPGDAVVGRVVALYRYPVKSMAAESLDAAEASWHGLAGDRRFAFVRPGLESSDFPWLTIRQRADLWLHRARFADPERLRTSAVLVTTPGGDELDVTDPALAARLGDGVRVIRQNRGTFDALPLSLMTTQTVAGLSALVDPGAGSGPAHFVDPIVPAPLDPLRFRPNLLIEATDDAAAFPEDAWVGATLRIGGLEMRVDERDQRCVMVNVDPETGERNAAILKNIAQNRESCLGVYGSTVRPGRVAVGDAVTITPQP